MTRTVLPERRLAAAEDDILRMEERALERVLVEEGEGVIKGERRGRKRVLERVVRKVGVVVRRRRRRLIPDDGLP